MRNTLRRAVATLAVLAAVATMTVLASPAEARRAPNITLNTVGTRFVYVGFRLSGHVSGTGWRHNKTIVLQRLSAGRWLSVARLRHRSDGKYTFPRRSFSSPGTRTYRTLVRRKGHTLDASPRVAVVVKRRPAPPPVPGNDLLPDLVVKRLNDCSAAEKAKNADGTCFSIVYPSGTVGVGPKYLKFPGTTYNIGTGPMEVDAKRSTSTSNDWTAQQVISTDNGVKRRVPVNATFFFAGDGHTHWHIVDFDSYELLDSTGAVVKVGEKHGYCMQDNVSYRGWLDDKIANPALHPGMPLSEVYTDDTACGFRQPSATSIVHGLSVGWGDTYPTSLPNQAIDISGVADGDYKVKVTAEARGILEESNTANNDAVSSIRIAGNTVTWLSDDAGS